MLEELKNKKVLILGFGKEGRDTFLFLRKLFPKKIIGIADKNEKVASSATRKRGRVKLHLGKNYLKALKNYDIIIKSPGIPPKVIAPFITKRQRVTSQTEIFFNNCPGKIVGITGTKGKSTTTALIYQILKQGGLKTHLVGNIGKPVLNLLFSAKKNDVYPAPLATKGDRVYVYELSSHQLSRLQPRREMRHKSQRTYGLKKSPQIAVFLNIYPEHLDYYRNFQEYFKAKKNITKYQTEEDYFIYNSGDKLVSKVAKKTRAKIIPIKGKYYELDRNAAIAVGKLFKIPQKRILKAIKEFKPLPHRLELVGTFKGIKFYNDALSTIPETAIAALDALGNNVQTIMLGGFDRKIDFKNLAKRVLKSRVENVILFPTTGKKIWQSIVRFGRGQTSAKLPRPFFVDRAKRTSFSSSTSPRCGGAQYMREAVKLAYQYTQKGKICLLSTASTSFSIFRDYKEKGNLFKKFVKKYGKK
jgi:UDP-N-acetylmuramoylalanine-D-glutamate ligase